MGNDLDGETKGTRKRGMDNRMTCGKWISGGCLWQEEGEELPPRGLFGEGWGEIRDKRGWGQIAGADSRLEAAVCAWLSGPVCGCVCVSVCLCVCLCVCVRGDSHAGSIWPGSRPSCCEERETDHQPEGRGTHTHTAGSWVFGHPQSSLFSSTVHVNRPRWDVADKTFKMPPSPHLFI